MALSSYKMSYRYDDAKNVFIPHIEHLNQSID